MRPVRPFCLGALRRFAQRDGLTKASSRGVDFVGAVDHAGAIVVKKVPHRSLVGERGEAITHEGMPLHNRFVYYQPHRICGWWDMPPADVQGAVDDYFHRRHGAPPCRHAGMAELSDEGFFEDCCGEGGRPDGRDAQDRVVSSHFDTKICLAAQSSPVAVEDLIAQFLQRRDAQACATSLGSFGNCNAINVRFVRFMRRHGYRARLLRTDGFRPDLSRAHSGWSNWRTEGCVTHYFAEVDGHGMFDFCYRQFDPDAPLPRREPPSASHTVRINYDEPLESAEYRFRYRKKDGRQNPGVAARSLNWFRYAAGEQQEAPNTKPAVKQTDTPEFKAWFGDSVVTVDGKPGGQPRVVYHGTPKAGFSKFSKFQDGIYFTSSPEEASEYASSFGPDNRPVSGRSGVYPVYLKISNPFIVWEETSDLISIDAKWCRQHGFDGVIGLYLWKDEETTYYVVLGPGQIKSAIGNKGAFDTGNPDITAFNLRRHLEKQATWRRGVLYRGTSREI
jgi:hypothetical protein